jgi:purine-nucleoside phosphorylase
MRREHQKRGTGNFLIRLGDGMELIQDRIREATVFVQSILKVEPKIGLILGTGLGGLAGALDAATVIPYGEIPHFPVSTAPGHESRLLCGRWAERPVIVMQGRFHLFEGYTAEQISFPVRVMKALGIHTLVISAAAGGLDPQFQAGDLMLISDHINLTGHNPLRGPNLDAWGPRFPDMAEPYPRKLQDLAIRTALSERLPLQRGVYVAVLGPSLETAAETRFLRAIGADAVGMSVVIEVITAVHCGMEVLGFAVITNVNLPDCYQPAVLEEIVTTAKQAGPKLMHLVAKLLEQL